MKVREIMVTTGSEIVFPSTMSKSSEGIMKKNASNGGMNYGLIPPPLSIQGNESIVNIVKNGLFDASYSKRFEEGHESRVPHTSVHSSPSISSSSPSVSPTPADSLVKNAMLNNHSVNNALSNFDTNLLFSHNAGRLPDNHENLNVRKSAPPVNDNNKENVDNRTMLQRLYSNEIMKNLDLNVLLNMAKSTNEKFLKMDKQEQIKFVEGALQSILSGSSSLLSSKNPAANTKQQKAKETKHPNEFNIRKVKNAGTITAIATGLMNKNQEEKALKKAEKKVIKPAIVEKAKHVYKPILAKLLIENSIDWINEHCKNNNPKRIFMHELNKFLAQRGKIISYIPLIDGKEVDLYVLYNETILRKGIRNVMEKKLLSEIAKILKIRQYDNTEVLGFILDQYQIFLSEYEEFYHGTSSLCVGETIHGRLESLKQSTSQKGFKERRRNNGKLNCIKKLSKTALNKYRRFYNVKDVTNSSSIKDLAVSVAKHFREQNRIHNEEELIKNLQKRIICDKKIGLI